MQLVDAIKDLVYSNDCVTIPGFGSFIANKFPSIYDESESKFYPPSRRLSFNLTETFLKNSVSYRFFKILLRSPSSKSSLREIDENISIVS